MINLFSTATQDTLYIFEQLGKDVFINQIERRAIISNSSISEYEDKIISTLDKISRGDLINYNDENYLIITESNVKRYDKYKALMRHCNYQIETTTADQQILIGYDDMGRPVYETIPGETVYIDSIVDNKSFSVDMNQAINLPNNQILVTMQDNSQNKELFTVNGTFSLMEKAWTILDVDLVKKGLMILTCQNG